ncbi:MAG: hypothetical protein ABIN36_05270 [Ferruginibacter sp.]
MKHPISYLAFISIVSCISGCLLTKGHFTSDGSAFIWNKDPNGKYNAHNLLQIDSAYKWIETIKSISELKKIKIDIVSSKFDHYEINDSIMFFGNHKELANYHSYKTFSQRLNIEPELLKSIVLSFDKLGLNRFYREDKYFAFVTQSYMTTSKGYFYFIDTILPLNKGDILDLRDESNRDNFRTALFEKFLILNKYDSHWYEWQESKN